MAQEAIRASSAIALFARPPHCEFRGSRPVSRVLSRTIIHLGLLSPAASSNLPGSARGRGSCFPIWSCSGWGLPCRGVLPPARCALTAPFHPYRPKPAVYFLWHFPWARAPQALPGTLPVGARTFLPLQAASDCLADSGANNTGNAAKLPLKSRKR